MKAVFKLIRRFFLVILIVLVLISATVYYFYWHWQPFTQNAFVFANTRPVSALVEGFITKIHIRNNQFVKKGEPLFTVFQPPYQLKVKELEHEIESLEAGLKSIEARIKVAQSDIARYTAELKNNRYLSDTAKYMYGSQAVSQAYAEERLRAQQASEAQVGGAGHTVTALTHDAEKTRALIKKTAKQLELAKIYNELTVVRALSDGYITNMTITEGGYYKPGDVLFGFVDSEIWWVQANFKENELSEIKPGQPARIWLWQYPGHELKGEVEAVGWGAERRRMSKETGMPVVEKENEWFLLPQRFPVQIRILDPKPDLALHVGASAYVSVDIPARPIRQFFWQLFLWW